MDKKFIFSIIYILCNHLLIPSNGNPLIGEKVEPAKQNDFPFVVSLGHLASCTPSERYLNHFCSGSLITKRHVLTAAHCVTDKNPAEVAVTAGNVDLNEGKIYAVDSWIIYNDWMMNNNNVPEFLENDIAVVTLSENVADIVPGIRSNLPESKIFGKRAIVAGWGYLSDNSRTQFLQKASVRVLTPKECKRNVLKLFGTEDAMPYNHYCTSAKPPVILALGDSGGPLVLKDTREIIGVNEATCKVDNAATHCYATSIHLKVNYIKEFIDDVSKE